MSVRKVALVHQTAEMSGVEFSTLYLAQHLDRERLQPIVVCPTEGPLLALCRTSGIPVSVVPLGRLFSISARVGKRYVPNPAAMLPDMGVLLAGALRLQSFLRDQQVSLVCTKGLLAHFHAGLAARLAGIPCVWHIQDRVSDRAFGAYRQVVGQSARLLADHVIADGASIVEQLPSGLRASGRVSLVHNGVDTEQFSPTVDGQGVRRDLGLDGDQLVVGNVARLTPWKGQHLLLEAFARLAPRFPRLHLLLVGSPLFDNDSYERQLRRRASESNLTRRVTFAGYRSDLPQVLAAIDVFAHTAVEKDTSPLALLSAMAAGKPIIAPDFSGVRELFRDGLDGLLVPPNDVDSLTTAIERLLADQALRARLGLNARERAVRELSVQRFTESCQEVFTKLLDERAAAPTVLRPHRPGSSPGV